MANLLYGVGSTYVKTTTLSDNAAVGAIGEEVIIPLYLFDFAYTQDINPLTAKGQIAGQRQTLASAQGESTATLKLSSQFVNWSQLGFFLNQFQSVQASAVVPVLKTAKIPSTSPYEITDAAITSGTVAGVYVYVSSANDAGYRAIAAGSVAAGEAKPDGSTGKITFHSSDAGKTATYTVPVTKSNIATYGGKGGLDKYGTIEFWGKLYGTEDVIHFPSLDYSTAPSLNFTGDVATLEVDFTANVDVLNGVIYPYTIYKKP